MTVESHARRVMPRWWRWALALLSLFALLACRRVVPLHTPGPIGANPDVETTRSAIHHALSRTSWVVREETPGAIVGARSEGGQEALVRITYNPARVQIEYVSSTNLSHSASGGGARINSLYNQWVRELARAVRDALLTGERYSAPPMDTTAPQPGAAPQTPAPPEPPAPSTAPPPDDRPRRVVPIP